MFPVLAGIESNLYLIVSSGFLKQERLVRLSTC